MVRYVTRPRRWSMAITWSRISSKVIATPPYADVACKRRCGNEQGRSGVGIPHIVDERKPEVRGARDATAVLGSQMHGVCVTSAWTSCTHQRHSGNTGAHHVPHHTICQKTRESQTAPPHSARAHGARPPSGAT